MSKEGIVHKVFESRFRDCPPLLDWDWSTLGAFANALVLCHDRGNASYWFGNGGSAAQADHMEAELTGRYKLDRPALSAHSLSTNGALVTAIANDFGFEYVFAKQLEGHGAKDDIAVGMSTSGNSRNIYLGLLQAKRQGMLTCYLGGPTIGDYQSEIEKISDFILKVPGFDTPNIQENHIKIIHSLAEVVESAMFGTD